MWTCFIITQKHHIKYCTHTHTFWNISYAYHIIQSAHVFIIGITDFPFFLLLLLLLLLCSANAGVDVVFINKNQGFFSLSLTLSSSYSSWLLITDFVSIYIQWCNLYILWFIKLTTTNNINAISMSLIQLKQMLRITHTDVYCVHKHTKTYNKRTHTDTHTRIYAYKFIAHRT